MTTVSPTDNGGRGHRPPDPQGGRNSVTEPSQMPAHEDQQPTNMGGVWCGPHEEIATPQELPTRRPALVTTPSDARGGRRTTGADEGTGAQPASPDAAQTANYRTGTPTSSYASVVRRGQEQQETGLAPVPTTIAGKWSPRHKQLLLETLACDWISPSTPVDTPAQANMRRVAMEPSKVHANTALRARTQMEAETLLAYLNETLELPHPPNFIKATLPVLQRAIIEQYHGIHLETPLTADVDPRARLRKSMTHNTILGMLYAANGDTARGRQMISRLMEDVKRLHFDGIHTLTFVFNSERVAHLYKGLAFRLNGACLELEDTSEDQEIGTYRHASLRRQYAVRIYGAEDLGLVVLLAALSQLPGVQVVDAERPRTESTDIIDNRFFLLRFPDEHCPDQLRGVTKIQLHGQLVTVHHHVVHQRLPCARCYAPYHTTGYCKANPAHLDATRAKFKRTYSGQLPEYDVGKAVLYHHSDGESLSNFLTRLQQEVTQPMVPSDGTPETSTRVELVATVPSPAAGAQLAETSRSAPNGATPAPKAGGGPNAGLLPDTDVFKTVMRRPQKPQTDAQTGGHIQPGTQQRSATGASTNDNQTRATTTDLATGGRDKRPPTRFKPTNQRQNGQRRAPGKGKGKATAKKAAKPPAFEKFKWDLAIGKYNLLDNGDSDDNAEDSEQEPDEAPYAYDPAPFTPYEAGDGRVDTSQAPTANATGRVEEDSAIVDTEMTDGSQTAENPTGDNTEDDIMASAPESLLSSYIGSSPPSSPRSPAPTPGSEFPYSLASTMDEDNQFVPETDGSQEEATQSPGGVPQAKHEELAQPTGPSMSQDGFTIEQVAPAPGMPQQLPVFLMPFNGTLAEVPSNGQCAYTALYATMTSTYETELKFTKDVVQGANVLKRSVYTLMLANLANDVDCNVVDPCRELRRLYPSQPPPTDKAVATAMLYDHYKQERARTVNAHVPSEFWAGPEILRAMAQFLREPLFVLESNTHNDAHVQRYFYQDYVLPNGDIHETGCGGAVDDATAKSMLANYARLHVMPVFLVLKRHEGHFYGVHHGDVSTKWQAEGDEVFTKEHCTSHSWYAEVLAHHEYSRGKLGQTDAISDTAETNEVLIGAMERRERLDVVHDRLQLQRLDSAPYDIGILDGGLRAEEDRLRKLAGYTGRGPTEPEARPGRPRAGGVATRRASISPLGRVAQATMQRILNSIHLDPELVSDRSKLRHLQAENDKARLDWRRHLPRSKTPHGLPTEGDADFLTLARWLLPHRELLHELFSYVPYPELVVKGLPADLLLHWGEMEVYDAQTAILRALLIQEAPPNKAKEYCRTWLAACTTEGGSTRDRVIARDPTRWTRLCNMYSAAPCGARPPELRDDQWHILHLLPDVVWIWSATSWGEPR